MTRLLLVLAAVALYLLHQDFWFWRTARPLVLGVLPIGLFYHACFSVASSLLLWLLVKAAWPSHLETPLADGPKRPPSSPLLGPSQARADRVRR